MDENVEILIAKSDKSISKAEMRLTQKEYVGIGLACEESLCYILKSYICKNGIVSNVADNNLIELLKVSQLAERMTDMNLDLLNVLDSFSQGRANELIKSVNEDFYKKLIEDCKMLQHWIKTQI